MWPIGCECKKGSAAAKSVDLHHKEWMPRFVQVNFQRLEHVIGCGHVSGFIVWLFTRRGLVW